MTKQPSEPKLSKAELEKQLAKYNWYHRIPVGHDLVTPGNKMDYHPDIWGMIDKALNTLDFQGKKVIDIGCRDGYFSFDVEKRGASSILGVDNDLSKGTTEFLIPYFDSKVTMQEENLYELTPDKYGQFDVVLFLGVLYHLRYPFWGLKKMVDLTQDGGYLVIESGMMVNPTLAPYDLMFCPVDEQYDATSCTFFNEQALSTTLASMGMEKRYADGLPQKSPIKQSIKRTLKSNDPFRGRQMFIYQKTQNMPESMDEIRDYWDGKHTIHTNFSTD